MCMHLARRYGCVMTSASVSVLFMFSVSNAQDIAQTPTRSGENIMVLGKKNLLDGKNAPRFTDPGVPALVPATNTPGGIPNVPSVNGDKPAKQPFLFTLHAEPIMKAGDFLARKGVYFSGWNVSQFAGIPSGGSNHGTFFNENAAVGIDLDMHKLVGISGAKIHFLTDEIAGQGHAGDFTGTNWGYLSWYGNHDGFHLREFTWDQSLFNDHLFILAGRSNPKTGEFEGSELYCMYSAFMCSMAPALSVNGSLPGAPTSTWGARFLIKPTKKTYIKAGIWEVEPWLNAVPHNSWPGDDWGLDKAKGEYIPVEGGYRTNFSNDLYPRAYDIGFVYDTAVYSDPLYNTSGRDRAVYGGTAQSRRGRTTFYLQAQQMVWKPEREGTRGLILFGAANFSTSGEQNIKNGFVLGAFDWGPFAGRPRDYMGFVVQSFVWNRHLVKYMDEKFAQLQPGSKWGSTETMLEFNYGFNVAPGVVISPYMEYIWHPDQLGFQRLRPEIKTAMQCGLSLNLQINPALGLPLLARVRN